jgi:hypothetical protein
MCYKIKRYFLIFSHKKRIFSMKMHQLLFFLLLLPHITQIIIADDCPSIASPELVQGRIELPIIIPPMSPECTATYVALIKEMMTVRNALRDIFEIMSAQDKDIMNNAAVSHDDLAGLLAYAEQFITQRSHELSADQLASMNNAFDILARKVHLDSACEQPPTTIERRLNVCKHANFFSTVCFKDDVLFTEDVVFKDEVKFKDKVTFKDDVTFKGDVFIDGVLSVGDSVVSSLDIGCDLTVGCNISMNDSISGSIGNVIKNGAPFIHTYPGMVSGNSFVGENAGNFSMTGGGNSGFGANVLANNTAGIFNTAVGQNAMLNNSTGIDNTAVGFFALINNATGSDNVAVGTNALQNSNDDQLVAVGSGALQSYTTSTNGFGTSQSVAVGYNALSSNTIGNRNTAVGWAALQSDVTDSIGNNTAVGAAALQSNTTAFGNTAVGTAAMIFNSTGIFNTAVGYFALGGDIPSDTIGNYNTAIGFETLTFNSSGSQNTVVGAFSMFNNATGMGNTVIGNSALYNNNGNNNVAVGLATLSSVFNATNNIAVGTFAGSSLTGTDSNNIMIGNTGVSGDNGVIRIGTNAVHTKAFMQGVNGVTTGLPAVAVLVDGNGQLGTVSSTRRVKHNIADMADDSSDILHLRPVTFAYNGDASELKQYGLIAEEVQEMFPALVVHDEDGIPATVQYHVLPVLLLNEMIKQGAVIESLHQRVAALEAQN